MAGACHCKNDTIQQQNPVRFENAKDDGNHGSDFLVILQNIQCDIIMKKSMALYCTKQRHFSLRQIAFYFFLFIACKNGITLHGLSAAFSGADLNQKSGTERGSAKTTHLLHWKT